MSIQKQFLKSKDICKVTFCLPGEGLEGSKEVMLLGDFNNGDSARGFILKPRNGEYFAIVDLKVGKEYQLRYLIDNNLWANDPKADKADFIPKLK